MQAVSFLLWLNVCILISLLGRNRKIGYGLSLVACLFLSPIIGLIVILCSKKLSNKNFSNIESPESKNSTSHETTPNSNELPF